MEFDVAARVRSKATEVSTVCDGLAGLGVRDLLIFGYTH